MTKTEVIGADVLDLQIEKIAGGDKSALAVFYRHTCSSVYSYALSILKDRHDAEDVLQDTFLQVWRSASKYRSMGKPMAWVITIARNLCLEIIRERQRFSDEPLEDIAGDIADEHSLTPEDSAILKACMEILSGDEREAVILHAVSGLRHREIAKILKLPLSTVLSRYNRAIKKLKNTLEGEV